MTPISLLALSNAVRLAEPGRPMAVPVRQQAPWRYRHRRAYAALRDCGYILAVFPACAGLFTALLLVLRLLGWEGL